MAMTIAYNDIESNSSSAQVIKKYDVFVSFRGEDTRNNFTNHLFGALERNGIIPFKDNENIRKGGSLEPELLQAIEGSRVLVVVFSKNYASSKWCLGELVKIHDCIQVREKSVLPIFYDVDPSHVRNHNQSGDYEEAFAKHKETFKEDREKLEEMRRWSNALTQIASLSGWDLRNKAEYAEIEHIVKEIISLLGYGELSILPKDLVVPHSHIEQLEKLLLLGSVDKVRVVGICGMGGIGKTTLVTALCERISYQFDACYSIDVSKMNGDHDPIGARKRILQSLNGENLQIQKRGNAPTLVQSRLHCVRALLVLDNVDQVEELVNREWFGAGSRIIIISRNEHILKGYGVDEVYRVPLLNWDYSLQLFCRKAFKCDGILTNYEKLTYDILEYANGHPLAIKVLGSSLLDRDVSTWRSALARLKKNPNKDIMDVLRLSFDGLQDDEKEIFLDIACFFNRDCKENYVKKVLSCCGFHADIGLRELVDKSLISIEYNWQVGDTLIEIHGLLQELGRKIVQENSIQKSRKWSRLWCNEHFKNVMSENMEKNVEVIGEPQRCFAHTQEKYRIEAETLSKMSHLRLLILSYGGDVSGSLNRLSDEIRYFEWYKCPLLYLPSDFQPTQLVELILKWSNIKQLWEGKKYLPNLRNLDLHESKNLIKLPDFREMPNLVRLNVEGCSKLVEIHPSIGVLKKLVFFNLKDCKGLVTIPNNILGLDSLEYLNLSGCSKVFNSPRQVKLDIVKWIVWPFQFLYPRVHNDSVISCSIPSLPSFFDLRDLDLSFCNLPQLPDAIGTLHCLETLNLTGQNFVTLPSLKGLSRLVYLNLQHCKQLETLPDLPSNTCAPIRKGIPEPMDPSLYIFNCPKLGERECYKSMTYSWMKRLIQAYQESFVPCRDIDIVIPGGDIPKWFNNQSVGSDGEITLDLPSVMHDNNWIGMVCCVVFVAVPLPGPTSSLSLDGWEPSVYMYISDEIQSSLFKPELILNRDLISVELNHICLIYISRQQFSSWVDHLNHTPRPPCLTDLRMYVRAHSDQSLHLDVKNFGWRWLFKQDLEPFDLPLVHSGNSPPQFLEIEDSAQSQPTIIDRTVV